MGFFGSLAAATSDLYLTPPAGLTTAQTKQWVAQQKKTLQQYNAATKKYNTLVNKYAKDSASKGATSTVAQNDYNAAQAEYAVLSQLATTLGITPPAPLTQATGGCPTGYVMNAQNQCVSSAQYYGTGTCPAGSTQNSYNQCVDAYGNVVGTPTSGTGIAAGPFFYIVGGQYVNASGYNMAGQYIGLPGSTTQSGFVYVVNGQYVNAQGYNASNQFIGIPSGVTTNTGYTYIVNGQYVNAQGYNMSNQFIGLPGSTGGLIPSAACASLPAYPYQSPTGQCVNASGYNMSNIYVGVPSAVTGNMAVNQYGQQIAQATCAPGTYPDGMGGCTSGGAMQYGYGSPSIQPYDTGATSGGTYDSSMMPMQDIYAGGSSYGGAYGGAYGAQYSGAGPNAPPGQPDIENDASMMDTGGGGDVTDMIPSDANLMGLRGLGASVTTVPSIFNVTDTNPTGAPTTGQDELNMIMRMPGSDSGASASQSSLSDALNKLTGAGMDYAKYRLIGPTKPTAPTTEHAAAKMSTEAKIAIGAGGVVVAGLLIWALARKK